MKRTKIKRIAYRCPECDHGFVRNVGKMTGRTSCPSCGERFSRSDGAASVEDASAVHSEVCQRRIKRNGKIYPIRSHESVIRGSQVPASPTEAQFKSRALAKGWLPHRPSWPDFLVECDGEIVGVEVKSTKDYVKAEQAQTFDLLEAAGLKIFIWKGGSGQLRRWRSSPISRLGRDLDAEFSRLVDRDG